PRRHRLAVARDGEAGRVMAGADYPQWPHRRRVEAANEGLRSAGDDSLAVARPGDAGDGMPVPAAMLAEDGHQFLRLPVEAIQQQTAYRDRRMAAPSIQENSK